MGIRGAWLVLPIFLLTLRVPMELAVPATTGVVGFVALSGTWDALMGGRMDARRSAWFGIPVAVIATLASLFMVAPRTPSSLLLWSFLGLAIVAGLWTMIRSAPAPEASSESVTTRLPSISWGAWNGLLLGIFGVGMQPSTNTRRDPMASINPSVFLAGIALGAGASLAIHIAAGNFRWTMVLPAVLAVTLGMELGGWASRKLPVRLLELSFGAMLLLLAIALGWRQFAS